MAFHGDYEVEFEIYEKGEDEAFPKLIGRMAGVSPYDAKIRWTENHGIETERFHKIYALFPPLLQ